MEERLDGKIYLMHGDRSLRYHEVEKTPAKPKPEKKSARRATGVTPAADHPFGLCESAASVCAASFPEDAGTRRSSAARRGRNCESVNFDESGLYSLKTKTSHAREDRSRGESRGTSSGGRCRCVRSIEGFARRHR